MNPSLAEVCGRGLYDCWRRRRSSSPRWRPSDRQRRVPTRSRRRVSRRLASPCRTALAGIPPTFASPGPGNRWPRTKPLGATSRPSARTRHPAGISEICVVRWGTLELEATATIHVDKTAPVITGALPARPPDHDGWWTDPVDFTFTASDTASGVAGCDTVTYAGPEGRGVRVAGGCRDVAGNSASTTQLLNYDATRPWVGGLTIVRRRSSAVLGWQTSPDVVRSEVVRSLAADGAVATTIYSGLVPVFVDSTLSGHAIYRYTVTTYDEAGNAASTTTISEPSAESEQVDGSPLRPADGARLSRPPLPALEAGASRSLLQRSALPRWAQDPQRVAEAQPSPTEPYLDIQGEAPTPHRGLVSLVRLARSRGTRRAPLREADRLQPVLHPALSAGDVVSPVRASASR